MDRIKVLFADDQKMIREGLGKLLSLQEDMEVVGEAADGVSAVALTQELNPDVLLLDLTMPKMSGFEVIDCLRKTASSTRVVVFTMNKNRAFLHQAIQGGALGYVLKGSNADNLLEAIRVVRYGGTYLCPLLRDMTPTEFLLNFNMIPVPARE